MRDGDSVPIQTSPRTELTFGMFLSLPGQVLTVKSIRQLPGLLRVSNTPAAGSWTTRLFSPQDHPLPGSRAWKGCCQGAPPLNLRGRRYTATLTHTAGPAEGVTERRREGKEEVEDEVWKETCLQSRAESTLQTRPSWVEKINQN